MIKLFRDFVSSLQVLIGAEQSKSPAHAVSEASFAALQQQFHSLRESEQSLRITMLSMGDGVIATDEHARITFLNPSAQELTGWTLERALGRPFCDIFRIYNSITGEPGEDIVKRVLTTGCKVNLANHTVLISADGKHRHISDSAAPIRDVQGNMAGVVLIFSDVTERYLLQQQLRVSNARSTAAIEMAKLGTWEYDTVAHTSVWSPVYKQIMGVPPTFEPHPDSWKEFVHPDDIDRLVEIRNQAMASGDRYTQQYRIRRVSDGKLRFVKTHADIERREDGKLLRLIGVLQDVTDELEIGERIRESEELYRSAFEQAVIGMAHIGLDGKFLRVNRSLCNILKYSVQELLSTNIREIVHQDDAKPQLENLGRLVSGRCAALESTCRYIRGDGTIAWLEISSTMMRNSLQEQQYILASVQDITVRQQAQMALKKSEQRLRRAQEISHTGNWEIDIAKKQMWASDEAFRIYGIPVTEGNTLPLAVAQDAVLNEYRSILDDALDRLLKYDAPYDLEFAIRPLDGGQRMVHSMAVVERNPAGYPVRVIGVLQDITERHHLEEEYGKALSTTLDGFWMCDKSTKIVLVNDAMCAMLGYTREELMHLKMHEVEVQSDLEAVRERHHRVVSKGAERFETELRCKDGTIFDVEVSLSYIPSSQCTCAFMRDITERKRRENHIRYLSYHDVLTGLYNRAYFEAECTRLNALRLFPVAVVMGDINGLKLTNDVFGHAQGDKLLCAIAKVMLECAREQDTVARIGGDEFCLLMPYSGPEEAKALCEQMRLACEREVVHFDDGNVLHLSLSLGYAIRWSMARSFNEVFKEAEDAMYKRKLLERKSMHSSLISSIRMTMYEKSRETREHADRMAELACGMGRLLGLDDNQISELELLCSLHDLGKIGIPEHILDKPGPLTVEEWVEMRKHPEIGYRIAQASPELICVAEGILSHHERWDGLGYPQGLKGQSIPLLARILSVADSFDAMTNDRVYQKAVSRKQALAEIAACAGTQFDPSICDLLIRIVRQEQDICSSAIS